MRSKAWSIAFGALVMLVTPRAADAYCRTKSGGLVRGCFISPQQCCTTGTNLFWAASCAGYSFSTKGSTKVDVGMARSMMRQAFDAWQNVPCTQASDHPSISAVEVDDTKVTTVGYDKTGANVNVILFRDDEWPYDSDNSLGLTTLSFDVKTGVILDADMELNTAEPHLQVERPVAADGFDLFTVLQHETGHFLGLAHSGDPTATMFAHYAPGTTDMSTLELDDMQGVCAMYPPSGRRDNGLLAATENCAVPHGGFDNGEYGTTTHGCSLSTAGAPPSGAWLGVGVASLLLGLGRRRRRCVSRARA